MTEILDHLNDKQIYAVTCPERSSLVLAGAGSGKTRVLLYRIYWLVHHYGIKPEHIIAVTFTNKAAREISDRLKHFDVSIGNVEWSGTFHGICNRILRIFASKASLSPWFTIMDKQDQNSLVSKVIKKLDLNPAMYTQKNIVNFINKAKHAAYRSHNYPDPLGVYKHHIRCYEAYEELCLENGSVDFAELILRSYELFGDEEVDAWISNNFKHLLVDEFQDTNELQYLWIKRIAKANNNIRIPVFAVGDDDQSIYSFRGACIGNILSFEKDFKISEIIRLEQNYRSASSILSAANDLIKNNSKRIGKDLWTDDIGGADIILITATNEEEEASIVTSKIRSLISSGVTPSDIAVLYRSNAQSRIIEQSMMSNKINYKVYGSKGYYERSEIKNLVSYLRLIIDSDNNAAFLRIFNTPKRGLGPVTLREIKLYANQFDCSLWKAARSINSNLLNRFVELMDLIAYEIKNLELSEAIHRIIELSGLKEFYSLVEGAKERISNMEQLVSGAKLFEASITNEELSFVTQLPNPVDKETSRSLMEKALLFLDHVSLMQDYSSDEQENSVNLITIHGSKGLEFDTVFIVGLEQGLLPHESSISRSDNLEEERRLMYVAITRAKNNLYLSWSKSRYIYKSSVMKTPSQFLLEISDKHLSKYNKFLAGVIEDHAPFTTSIYKPRASAAISQKLNNDKNIYGSKSDFFS